jgi:tetratricopeptide (TPR) repeat protein
VKSATAALAGLLTVSLSWVPTRAAASRDTGMESGKQAYESGDYPKAVQLLSEAAAAEPQNAEIQLLLTKTHLEMFQYEAAIKSAERAVALESKNSVYHEWLGRAYGEKADHSGFMSALGFAKKTQREFQTAVELDGKNFAARQSLIEYDCAAPSMANGGEDKAQPQIAEIAKLDVAEGHYATGNCRRQKKDFATADAEFGQALESGLKAPERVFDIGDYAVRHEEPSMLVSVADLGAKIAPGDVRAKFYRAVAEVLSKQAGDAEKLLREYLKAAILRNGYPRPSAAHYWLGRLFENAGNISGARGEYEATVKEDGKNKVAQEALKRVRKE